MSAKLAKFITLQEDLSVAFQLGDHSLLLLDGEEGVTILLAGLLLLLGHHLLPVHYLSGYSLDECLRQLVDMIGKFDLVQVGQWLILLTRGAILDQLLIVSLCRNHACKILLLLALG